uniref:ATPase AAA-type core domain-containing protein n=1 Tax=Parascaris equorum TaxID=6256 RepID=A0A914RVQ9_PAREQ
MAKEIKHIVHDSPLLHTFAALDENDIAVLKRYGQGAYAEQLKQLEMDIEECVNELSGVKESDTGLAPPALWDIAADKQAMQSEQPLQVARCTKIITSEGHEPRYMINAADSKERSYPTTAYLLLKLRVQFFMEYFGVLKSPRTALCLVEEKPDVTYADVGGCKDQIEKLREVVETPLLHVSVLLYGPPGTGKTLCARAVANRTDACFIRVIGSELVQKYVGEGARMVRELFEMARTKKVRFFTVRSLPLYVGGARFDDGMGGDNEVQRTMLELINQLDGFDPRGNIKGCVVNAGEGEDHHNWQQHDLLEMKGGVSEISMKVRSQLGWQNKFVELS